MAASTIVSILIPSLYIRNTLLKKNPIWYREVISVLWLVWRHTSSDENRSVVIGIDASRDIAVAMFPSISFAVEELFACANNLALSWCVTLRGSLAAQRSRTFYLCCQDRLSEDLLQVLSSSKDPAKSNLTYSLLKQVILNLKFIIIR